MFFGCVVGVERREIGRHLVQNQKFIIAVEGINKNNTTWGKSKKEQYKIKMEERKGFYILLQYYNYYLVHYIAN